MPQFSNEASSFAVAPKRFLQGMNEIHGDDNPIQVYTPEKFNCDDSELKEMIK